MNILAIDASTKSTGIAIFKDKKFLGKGCITASSTDLFKRIHKMVDSINTLIAEAQIDEIVMEEVIPDHSKNTNTFKALMYL
jgi:Holliday junction resolvasome RuvABC endonuclease subunit